MQTPCQRCPRLILTWQLGMLKRNILEVMQLERAFTALRKGRKKKVRRAARHAHFLAFRT
jgi:hypothetical protein